MSGPAADPQALIAKHAATTQQGADADAALIAKVEGQLANSPMGWLQGLLGETSSKADAEKGAAEEKVEEMKDEVDKNKKDAPPDAGPPPQPSTAAKPSVQTPQSAKGGDKGAPAKKGGEGGKGKQPAKGGGQKPAAKGGGAAPGGGDMGGMVAALAAGDGDISAALDAYQPKSPETMQTVSKIKQMGDVAKGFSGQIDTYIGSAGDGVNGALARAGNWIGEGKNIAAVWANNPYKKAEGFLGTIMKVLSAIKSIAGVVGSICGKIGLILTVVGLLGMIFPPIGAAVSTVARILNIVGLICDVISFALSGVLTGLNGVRLAQLIASGASPEEKAACADQMMTEANDAAGSLISLAMQFGPKFMKGMLGKSKGIINGLMKRAKAVLGGLASKAGANVKNFVNKVLRKFGVGVKGSVVKGAFQAQKGIVGKATDAIKNSKPVKLVTDTVKKVKGSKVWNKPADMIKSTRDKLMTKYGDKFKGLENWSAKTNAKLDKYDLEMKVEKWGEKAGGIGENWKLTKGLNEGTDKIEEATKKRLKELADQDTAALAKAREDYLQDQSKAMRAKYEEMVANKQKGRTTFAQQAGELNAQSKKVGDITKKEAADAAEAAQKSSADSLAEAEQKELAEKAAKEARNADPAKYAEQAGEARRKRYELETSMGADDAERKRLLQMGEANLSEQEAAQLKKLKEKLKPLDDARAADALAHKTISGGGEQAALPQNTVEVGKTAWDIYKKGQAAYDQWLHLGEDGPKDRSKSWESAESFDFKDPLKWNKSSAAANADKRASADAKTKGGAPALSMPDDKADFHAFVVKKAAGQSIASGVKAILGRIKRKDPTANTRPTTAAAPTAAPQQQATSTPGATPTASPQSRPAPTATPTPAPTATPAPAAPQQQASTPAPAAPQQQANTPAPAAQQPAAAPTGATPATPTPAPTGGDTPSAEPQAAEPAAADPAGGGGEGGGGGEPLPYWPKLIAPDGEFTMAMKEFTFMRKVAVEFKKGQIAAKQKGVDTLATYGKYDEYAAKRKAEAQAHSADTTAAGQVTVQNQQAAGEGEQQSGKAQSEQQKGEGQAGQKAAVDLPEPESRGFWGRIIGRIKRWAKNKAAEIFGWIQGKIADVILKGLCGVSMGDMKSYSTALKNQQARAKGVADTGVQTTAQASGKQDEVKTTAQQETSKAEADIAEADTNIQEADTFLQDINTFEQTLKQEMSAAAAFIQQITAEVTAARAKDKEEKAKAAAEAQQQAQQQAQGADGSADPAAPPQQTDEEGGGDPSAPDVATADGQSVDAQAPDAPQAQEEEEDEDEAADDEANDAVVKEAVSFVGSSGDTAVGHLETKKDDYKNQLEAATTNRDKGQVKEIEPQADKIVGDFKTTLADVKESLAGIEGSSEATVEAIISVAANLDKAIASAHQALDQAFTGLYDQIKGSKKKLGARVMDGINEAGSGVEDAAHAGLDKVEPYAEKAWKGASDVAGAIANPIVDYTVVPAGEIMVSAVGLITVPAAYVVTGAGIKTAEGVGAGMEAYGEAAAQNAQYGVPMVPY